MKLQYFFFTAPFILTRGQVMGYYYYKVQYLLYTRSAHWFLIYHTELKCKRSLWHIYGSELAAVGACIAGSVFISFKTQWEEKKKRFARHSKLLCCLVLIQNWIFWCFLSKPLNKLARYHHPCCQLSTEDLRKPHLQDCGSVVML
jgi:hypothetical protein